MIFKNLGELPESEIPKHAVVILEKDLAPYLENPIGVVGYLEKRCSAFSHASVLYRAKIQYRRASAYWPGKL